MDLSDLTPSGDEFLCAGLPLVDTRVMDSHDLKILRRWRIRLLLRAFKWLILAPCTIAAPVLVGLAGDGLGLNPEGLVFVSCLTVSMLFFLVGAEWAVLSACDSLTRSKQVKRSAQCCRVRCFRGTVRWCDDTDASIRILLHHGLLTRDSQEPVALELFTDRDTVYSVNGEAAMKWVDISVTRAAARPAEPVELAVPSRWYEPTHGVALERRRLTPGEIEEVRGYGRFTKRRIASALGAVFAIVLIGNVLEEALVPMMGLPRFSGALMGVCIVTIPLTFRFLKSRRIAKLYQMDAEHGWAIIVSPESCQATLTDDETSGAKRIEFLPATRVLWTIDDRPAGWRRKA